MKASELKVGTRVRLVSEEDANNAPVGREGTVVKTDRHDADVVWDNYSGGHNGDSHNTSNNHWYLYNDDSEQAWEIVIEKKKRASIAKQIYKGNGKHDWESVIEGTKRLRVPGGFIYTVHYSGPVFVPLPEMVHPI